MRVKLSRRARWAVPVIAVAVTGGVIAGMQIPAAQASPVLPARTPAQLLAEINRTQAAAADRHRGGDDLPRPAAAAAGRQPDVAVVAAHRLAHGQGLLPERAALPAVGAAAGVETDVIGPTAPSCGSGSPPATRSPSSRRPPRRSQAQEEASRRRRRSPRSRPPTRYSRPSARPRWSACRTTSWSRTSPPTSWSSRRRTTAR